jgi:hemerythrin-like metal-binding protein
MRPYVTWKSYYSVGEPSLDDQHKKVLVLINGLYDAVERGDDRAAVKPVLNELLQYALTHFQYEEKLMRERGYSRLAEHMALHEDFRRQARIWRGESCTVAGHDLLKFLKQWWVGHIQSEDKNYMPLFQLAGSHS